MDITGLLLSITALLLLGGGAAIGLWYLSVNIWNPGGKNAEKKTKRILTRYAMPRGFKVLFNLSFSHKSRTYVIENVLIGFFGILLVKALGGRGEYYGQLDGKSWQKVLGDKKEALSNPVAEQEQAIAVLRAILTEKKLYSIPIEGVVYMTNRSKKTSLFVTNSGRILLPGKLAPYLRKTKFDKDTGLDIGKIMDAIGANKS